MTSLSDKYFLFPCTDKKTKHSIDIHHSNMIIENIINCTFLYFTIISSNFVINLPIKYIYLLLQLSIFILIIIFLG